MGGQRDQKFAITHLLAQGEAHLETVAPNNDGCGVVSPFQGAESFFVSHWLPSPLCSVALQLTSSSDSSSTSRTSLTSAEEEGEENEEEYSNQEAPYTIEQPVRFQPRNMSKRMVRGLGHPVGHPLWCGPCRGGLFVLNPPAGGVGSYNHDDIGGKASVVGC